MSENGGSRIRVTLRWIQIKDNKEAMWDDEGEFRFRSKVTTAGQTNEIEFPEQGYWSISDHPRRNKVDKIDKVLYEGETGDSLVVELFGVELDQLGFLDLNCIPVALRLALARITLASSLAHLSPPDRSFSPGEVAIPPQREIIPHGNPERGPNGTRTGRNCALAEIRKRRCRTLD